MSSNTRFKRLLGRKVLLTTLAILGLAIAFSGAMASAGSQGTVNYPALIVAYAARASWQVEATGDFWNEIATCINEPTADLNACVQDAVDELQAELNFSERQLGARLALLAQLGTGRYDPDLDPADFSPNITNPYFPLVPGRTLVYEKIVDGEVERIEVTALNDIVDIDGFLCRAVRDVVTLDGEVIEDTTDWYSQDDLGNVWYMGEISMNYEDGFLDSLDGSWRMGKDGAKPGIVMHANPVVGLVYRQEFQINVAEDIGKYLGTNESITIALGTYTQCIQTEDTTPIEPDALEHKFYAPGIGFIFEIEPTSGEALELIQIINP